MRNDIPVLKFSSSTPKYTDYGLYLNASGFHPGAGPGAVWFHGVLSVEPEGSMEDWLGALNVILVSETNQIPQIAPVFGSRTLVQEHFKEADLEDGRKAWVLPFSFNLRDIAETALYDDNFFAHVSARRYCTTPVRIVRAPSELLVGPETGAESEFARVNYLLRGYDAAGAGRFPMAVEFFEKAFASEELRADLDRLNLYNAAYCAAQAALEAEPGLADRLLDKTANWLQEDLRLRNELLMQIQQKLGEERDESRKTRLAGKRVRLLQDLGLVGAAA